MTIEMLSAIANRLRVSSNFKSDLIVATVFGWLLSNFVIFSINDKQTQ
ncbi:hypothetical protein [Nostoc sp.]